MTPLRLVPGFALGPFYCLLLLVCPATQPPSPRLPDLRLRPGSYLRYITINHLTTLVYRVRARK